MGSPDLLGARSPVEWETGTLCRALAAALEEDGAGPEAAAAEAARVCGAAEGSMEQ